MRKPDVIGIGFRRCASSWLHHCLNEHPEVGKTRGGIHYFSNQLDKGDDWYLQQFTPFADKKVLVDLSISYAYPKNVANFVKNMPELLPGTKIFAVIRNPIDRAYSDYRRGIFKEEIPESSTFEQAIEKFPELLERGHYRKLLQPFIKAIPKERIKFFFFDDISAQPNKFWPEFCIFLDISPDFVPSCLHAPRGHLAPPKKPGLHHLLRTVNRGISNWGMKLGLGSILRSIKGSATWRKMLSMSLSTDKEMPEGIRKELIGFYSEDIDFLADYTGRNLSGWRQ